MAGGSIGGPGAGSKVPDLSELYQRFAQPQPWSGIQNPTGAQQQHPGFAAPFPYGGGGATPIYPQLQGGEWNQMTQQMAGPGYQALPPPTPAAPKPGFGSRPGMSNIQPMGGGQFGAYGVGMPGGIRGFMR